MPLTDNVTATSTDLGRPTRIRYGVLGFASALSMITYLDRVCMGSAAPEMVKDLGLDSIADLKWAFAAFGFAYALFEVPSGWLGDVFGPRKTLIRIVLWWSAFTALTGLVGMHLAGITLGGLGTLIVIRFLFGMGEAGAYPNITRALHNWFPFQERGFTQGTVWMSGRLMGGLTPLIWGFLLLTLQMPWRATFWLFGVIGVVWCVVFARWFRNRPEEKPQVNQAELQYIRAGDGGAQAAHRGIPWLSIISSRNLWILCLMYACQSYGWYFYLTYLPDFMETQFGVHKGDLLADLAKGGPLWMGAAGCLIGGLLTDWYIRRTGNRRVGRRLFGFVGHALTAICFLLCPLMPNAITFFLMISLSGFFTDLTMGSSWAICQDIGRRYAAIVAGFMNMIGNLGGAVGPLLSGYVLDYYLRAHAAGLGVDNVSQLPQSEKIAGLLPGYHANFYVFAAVFALGSVCWSLVDATKPVVQEQHASC